MQKVIFRSEVSNYPEQIDSAVIDYISEGQIESYEGFDDYSILAFDWYDITNLEAEPSQIMIYLDREDLFYLCENETSYEVAKKLFATAPTNEKAVYHFFRNLFKADAKNLERMEDEISDLDDSVIHGDDEEIVREKIVDYRYNLLRLKKYYEQFDVLFEELTEDDNGLISEECLKYFEILENRTGRLLSEVMNLREYVVQIRESYQAQIDIQQNRLMKVFTLVTSIFMPLSFIAGWYGMNLQMPETGWTYGYLGVILLCIVICVTWIVVFVKKGWFK